MQESLLLKLVPPYPALGPQSTVDSVGVVVALQIMMWTLNEGIRLAHTQFDTVHKLWMASYTVYVALTSGLPHHESLVRDKTKLYFTNCTVYYP